MALSRQEIRKTSSEEWLEKRAALKNMSRRRIIVIASALVPGRVAPVLITEKMVKSMQPEAASSIFPSTRRNCELTVSGKG